MRKCAIVKNMMKFIYKIVLVRMRYANEGMYVQQIKFFVGGVLFVVVVC